MKLAIRVKNEFDRLNVIPFFEKHFPNCNRKMWWELFDIKIDCMLWVDSDNDLRNTDVPSDYTLLDGVPENLELPKSALVELQNEYQNKYQGIFNLLSKEHNLTLLVTEMDEIIREVNKISSREQLLEECLRDLCYELTGEQESEDELEKGLGIRLASLVHQAKKLLENK